MIRPIPWCRLPSEPIRAALPALRWQAEGELPPSAGIAALMLYVALNFVAHPALAAGGNDGVVAEATYDALGDMTGLSRSLIADGLTRLIALGLITTTGSAQKRRYWIKGPHKPWFKLPCLAIVRQGAITPFKAFTLRSKFELHAMKLYLYLAACRDNVNPYAMVSYETIYARTGIPERDIRRALSVLIGTGLVVNIDREYSRTLKVNEANKYYLTGASALLNSTATTSPAVPAAA